jgi:uridine phosphorylase
VLGELLIATGALAADGTSQALGADGVIDASLAVGGPARSGVVVSTDLFYDERDGITDGWLAAGAIAVEMEAATLFALARSRGLQAGAVLIVSDVVLPTRNRIDPEALREAEHRLGELAVRALRRPGVIADELHPQAFEVGP